MERLNKKAMGLPSSDYRCMNEAHPGKIPSNREVKKKCLRNNCPWLMTKAEYDKWCKVHHVYFIGG